MQYGFNYRLHTEKAIHALTVQFNAVGAANDSRDYTNDPYIEDITVYLSEVDYMGENDEYARNMQDKVIKNLKGCRWDEITLAAQNHYSGV